jgi:thioredoxin-like negative regulator of GroEL
MNKEIEHSIEERNKGEIQSALGAKETFALYLYTPLCGTCKVGEKMLQVVYAMNPSLPLVKSDLNFLPELAQEWEVMSVPCLAIIKEGHLVNKVYALGSVVDLANRLKGLEEGK